MSTVTNRLSGKVCLVTGASSGIGRATALLFAREGALVAVTARREQELDALVAEVAGSGGTAHAFPADITDDSAVAKVVADVVSHFGSLAVLVNDAGVLRGGATGDVDMANWDANVSVNARAAFCFLTHATPHLKAVNEAAGGGDKGGACVVNVSSVNGQQSFGGCVAYCASKAALDMVTRCASVDLAPFGVRVNSVNPGVTVTNLQKSGGMNDDAYEAFLARSISTTHPLGAGLGRVASPEEVAEAICFLASPSASFVSGALLPVDGARVNLGAR